MKDARPPFEDAIRSFRKFASDNGKPTDFLWISQDCVRVVLGRVWIFCPDDLVGDRYAERFYESTRSGESSIKLIGIKEMGSRYIVGVEKMPAPPHHPMQFYVSLHKSTNFRVRYVTNRLVWTLLHCFPSFSRRDRRIRDQISLNRSIDRSLP